MPLDNENLMDSIQSDIELKEFIVANPDSREARAWMLGYKARQDEIQKQVGELLQIFGLK